jgi:hypothetical protein
LNTIRRHVGAVCGHSVTSVEGTLHVANSSLRGEDSGRGLAMFAPHDGA